MFAKVIRFIVLPVAVFLLIGTVFAQDTTFTISPSGQVVIGTQLVLHCVAGSAGTTHYEIYGSVHTSSSFNELGGPDNTAFLKTEEWGGGNLTITCTIRHDGETWTNAERVTQTIQVLQAPAPQPGVLIQHTGGINFQGYCIAAHYNLFTGDPTNAYSGVCAANNQEVSLDMYDICLWQYQGALPNPGLSNAADLYNWSCNSLPAYVAPEGSAGLILCEGAPASFMFGIVHGRSTLTGGKLNVRLTPGGKKIVGQLANGEEFDVIEGPACQGGAVHWHIRNGRIEGWVKEGDEQSRYIQPWMP